MFYIGLALGIVLGVFIMAAMILTLKIGVLQMNFSDPDGPYLFLELSKDLGFVAKRKWVLMSVNTQE